MQHSTRPARPKYKQTPPRLDLIFQRYAPPIYFVTFNTHRRRPLLAEQEVHTAFTQFCERALEFRAGVGRYVLMPDHVHLFIANGGELRLSDWVRLLKQHLGKTLRQLGRKPTQVPGQVLTSFWQPGFLDHLLRSNESYTEKWHYVWRNPVRAGLVAEPEDWPYQGEIVRIDRV